MKNSTGFTLIEVLVTMVIMAIGLLGLAGLQAASLKKKS
ncbi:type IV pilus modification PilV family protein [Thiolapillus sp.]